MPNKKEKGFNTSSYIHGTIHLCSSSVFHARSYVDFVLYVHLCTYNQYTTLSSAVVVVPRCRALITCNDCSHQYKALNWVQVKLLHPILTSYSAIQLHYRRQFTETPTETRLRKRNTTEHHNPLIHPISSVLLDQYGCNMDSKKLFTE